MIVRLFALCLLRTVSLFQTPERLQQNSWTVAEVGGSVSLSCPIDVRAIRLFVWYKQSPGFMIQTVLTGALGETTFLGQFKNSRFTFIKGDNYSVLNINNVRKEDEASYLCLSLTTDRQTFVNGTFLAVNDYRMKSFYVKQNPDNESVHLGASVNLQCSLVSKNKEKRIRCPGERTVHWFRAASGEPHPGYIYSDGNTSAECEERSCVYNLSKTIQNPSDSGTYYCAVVTCGKILFGQGTKIQTRPEWDPVVLVLGGLLVCCVIVIVILIFYINKRKVCHDYKEATSSSNQLGYDESTESTDLVGEPEAESYVTLRFSTKPAKGKRKKREPQQECVYSAVRIHHSHNQSAS